MVGVLVPREKVRSVLLTGLCRVSEQEGDLVPCSRFRKNSLRWELEIGRPVRWPFRDVPNVQEGAEKVGRRKGDVVVQVAVGERRQGCPLWDPVRTEGRDGGGGFRCFRFVIQKEPFSCY